MPNTKEKSGKYFKVFVCVKVQGNWGIIKVAKGWGMLLSTEFNDGLKYILKNHGELICN